MRRPFRVPLGQLAGSSQSAEGGGGTVSEEFGGTPGPAGFRPGNWDFKRSEYTIAQGDTLWGLATTYLGQGSRWRDIWSLQTQPWGSKSPNGGPYLNRFYNKPDPSSENPGRPFMEGDVLIMPAQALKNAKAMAQADNVQPMPTTPGAPGWQPGGGEGPNVVPQELGGISTTTLLIGGAVVLGLVLLSD